MKSLKLINLMDQYIDYSTNQTLDILGVNKQYLKNNPDSGFHFEDRQGHEWIKHISFKFLTFTLFTLIFYQEMKCQDNKHILEFSTKFKLHKDVFDYLLSNKHIYQK